MSDRDPREQVLRRLVQEARSTKAADVEWSGVEERLMREVRRRAPEPRRSAWPLAWGALAVAAAAALWLGRGHAPAITTDAPPAVTQGAEPQRRNGDELELGTHLVADVSEVSVAHAGRATWTLSPNSSAFLAENGAHITVHLERGSVLSEVVPSPKPETFVVEAAGARVAVHGTVFRVSLEGERVLVDVREGVVAVGPVGRAASFLLRAPAHGEIGADGSGGSINGVPVDAMGEHRAGTAKSAAVRPPGAVVAGSASSPAPGVELPIEPSISDIEAGIAPIVDATADCFRRHTQSADGVEITVHTALSLSIAGSGEVTDIDFQPPLPPEAEACASDSIAKVTFAPSKQGGKVTRMLELKR